ETQRVEFLGRFVAGQGDEDGAQVVGTLAQVLRNLAGFDSSDGQIDHDAVGVKALGADAGFESRSRRLDPEIVPLAPLLAQAPQQRGIGAHDEDFMIDLRFEVPQGHPVLLEKAKQMLARDAAILRAWDAISTQAARIEPLAHGAGRDFAYLRDLTGG